MSQLRFLAQNVLTGAWLDFDVPLTREGETPRWELSGTDSFVGTIEGEHPWLHANDPANVLAEWSTVLYLEVASRIRWGGIVQRSGFDGPSWRVEAFGFLSYANGYPYTGDYQRFIGADPGVVWSALWTHIQGQPDGNLGLRSIMPGDLGPNIGTTDEPYELSWWEARDVGSELQSLATEAAFDYVESHEWMADRPDVEPPVIRLGYGNLEGGYNGTDKGWMKKRADAQVVLIGAMHRSLFVAVELHEETSDAMPAGAHLWFLSRMQKKLGVKWQLAEGGGGNHLLYDSSLWAVVDIASRVNIPDPAYSGKTLREAWAWRVQDRRSGLAPWVGGYHLRANDNDGTSRNASRLAAAHDVDQLFTPARRPAIVAGDWNDAGEGSDDVLGIVRAETGLQSLKRRVDDFPYDGWNSFGKKRQGKHIDSVLTNPDDWDIDDVRGVPTRGASDHQLWLSVDLVYRPKLTDQLAAGTPTVRHTVELSYPKSGRRREDLRFVQGENVVEVVSFDRDGSRFSNDVVVLGKGEGTKTVRGGSSVRDGRLRRPFVYTDKLAGTRARCDALARRERGWRNLKVGVDSIVVADHSNAPLWSWELGDDILLEAFDVPNLGDVADWFRVVGWNLITDSTARLSLERADAFAYGPTVPAPSDDLPDEEERGDR